MPTEKKHVHFAQMQENVKRYKPSSEKLAALISSFKAGQDYYSVGTALGMKRRTINHAIHQFLTLDKETILPSGGHAYGKWDDEMKDFLLNYIQQKPWVCNFFVSF